MDKYRELLDHDRLTAYLDGELSDEEAVALEDELNNRPELHELLAELRTVRDFMQRLGPTPAPTGFFGRVTDAVDGDAASAPKRRWWNGMSGPILSIALAATFLFVLTNIQKDLASFGTATAPSAAPAVQDAAPAPREVRMEVAAPSSAGSVAEAAPPPAAAAPAAAPPAAPPMRLEANPVAQQGKPAEAKSADVHPAVSTGIHMAPDAYRLTGPTSLDALRGAAAAVGGKLVDASGAPAAAPAADGLLFVELDAAKVGAFRAAMEGKTNIQSLGMGRVVEGTFKLRIYVQP